MKRAAFITGVARRNDPATLERAITYCKGQAMFDPTENPEYDKGVAACVRMLEDMMPFKPPATFTASKEKT